LNCNKWVRQTHRWLSIAFTVAVIINIVAVVTGRYATNWGSVRRTAAKIRCESWSCT